MIGSITPLVQGTSTEKKHASHSFWFRDSTSWWWRFGGNISQRLKNFDVNSTSQHDTKRFDGLCLPVGNGGFRKASMNGYSDVDLDVSPYKCKSPHMAVSYPVKLTRFHDDQLEEIQSSCNMFAAIRYACFFCILPSFSWNTSIHAKLPPKHSDRSRRK